MKDDLLANRFRIQRLIGQGYMGQVYSAIDTTTSQLVAVKVLKQDVVEHDRSMIERFKREGEMLRMLDHPNIVKVLHTFEEAGQHYIVMEYVEGGSLAERLRGQPKLPFELVMSIALDLTDALTKAHRHKIIHRDIKPANMLLTSDLVLRLTDFGIARFGELSRITQKGVWIGTMPYLSPEALNADTIDERADIWAFGVVLYEMLAGQLPFAGADQSSLITSILTKEPADLRQFRDDVPPTLAKLIGRMLAKNLDQRISSIRQVGAELDTVARAPRSESPAHRAGTAGERPKKARAARSRWPSFDLLIDGADAEFTVQAHAASGDLPSQRFVLPFDLHALPYMRKQIGDWVKQARIALLADNEELRQAREFGGKLFDQIFTGQVLDSFQANRAKLSSGERLRVRLNVPDQLASLPWELLFDRQAGQFLMHARDLSIMRYSDVAQQLESLRVDGPLQVVAVLASPMSVDYPAIKLDQELRRIRAALDRPIAQGQIALDVIQGSETLRQLNARFRKPVHVLHILCHGDLDEASGEGALVFEDADGRPDLVTAELLRVQLLDQRDQLRLALLNACQTALPVGKDPFSSMGVALVRSGVPAVIAMQFALAQDAAFQLTEIFYDELAAGQPVDLALTKARLWLYGRYPSGLEWAVPVLFLRAEDGVLFELSEYESMDRPMPELPGNMGQSKADPRADIFARYENGLRQLIPRLQLNTKAHYEALTYQQRLLENITQTRRFGDTSTRKSERASIINQLNEMAFTELNTSFNKLCEITAPPPLVVPQPPVDRGMLRQLWNNALKAFFQEDWARAETLLIEVASTDAEYQDVQARLTEVRRHRHIETLYRQASELRNEQQWEAAQRVIDELDALDPGFPDPAGLRAWIDHERRRQECHEAALAAYSVGDWAAAIAALEALLAIAPDDQDADALLVKARRRQDELQRQRDIEEQRRHQATAREQLADAAPPPLPAQQILVHLESGDFTKALTLIVAILQERPNDREALQWLARMIEIPNMPLLQRLRAARLASEVGDQRPGVCTFEPAWCAIPGGKYSVGAQPDPYNETSFSPQKLRVRGFSIARYPVTVWQFRQFLEHPQGYASREWWTGNGWAWKQEQGASKPSRWGVREWMLPNQPVVGVSWYEAAAFCAWLTRRLRERGLLGIAELVRLPTEAEWEVAAKLDSHEGVAYVWQPPHDELWQNVAESGLSLPAPVGIFPQGQSPCGALDMAGNVWEWCGSPYDAYPPGANRLQNDYPLDKMGPALRGGAYHLSNRASGWSARTWYFPNLKHPFQGFRVVRASKWSFG